MTQIKAPKCFRKNSFLGKNWREWRKSRAKIGK